jgi:hypothetical protein
LLACTDAEVEREPQQERERAPRSDRNKDEDEVDEGDLWSGGVNLEAGEVEVYTDVRGYSELAFVLEENNAEELSEARLAELEADLDSAEVGDIADVDVCGGLNNSDWGS